MAEWLGTPPLDLGRVSGSKVHWIAVWTPPDWRKPDQTPPDTFWAIFNQFSMAERLGGPIASFGPRPQVNFLYKPGGSGPLLNRGGLLDGQTTWDLGFPIDLDGRMTWNWLISIDLDGRMTWELPFGPPWIAIRWPFDLGFDWFQLIWMAEWLGFDWFQLIWMADWLGIDWFQLILIDFYSIALVWSPGGAIRVLVPRVKFIFWANFFQISMAVWLESPIASFGPEGQVQFLSNPGQVPLGAEGPG